MGLEMAVVSEKEADPAHDWYGLHILLTVKVTVHPGGGDGGGGGGDGLGGGGGGDGYVVVGPQQ